MTSGRLTPAAATAIKTSPSPSTGTGRSSITSTSGPPGSLIATARMVAACAITSLLVTPAAAFLAPGTLTMNGPGCYSCGRPRRPPMSFLDDDRPKKKPGPQPGEILADLSVDELRGRIALYRGEIER